LLVSPLVAVSLIALSWLPMIPSGAITLGQWAYCVILTATFALAVSSVSWALSRWIDPTESGAIVFILAIAWLTWPVWLASALVHENAASIVSWLVVAHPLFAINGLTFERLGIWTQQPLMYGRLTTLGQDVFYELPRSIWPCVISHGLTGAMFITISMIGGRRRGHDDRDRREAR
jgi:hypothetical protein